MVAILEMPYVAYQKNVAYGMFTLSTKSLLNGFTGHRSPEVYKTVLFLNLCVNTNNSRYVSLKSEQF